MTNKKDKGIIGVMVFAGLLAVGGIIHGHKMRVTEKKNMHALEQKKAARGQDFADYVLNDVNTYVLQNKASKKEIDLALEYYDRKNNDEQIACLAADSAKYADAIVRDAPAVMEDLDKTSLVAYYKNGVEKLKTFGGKSIEEALVAEYDVSLKDALKYVQSQKSLVYWPDPYGKDTLVVYGSNKSAARTMKVNIQHLKDICVYLARERAIRAQAIKASRKR